MRNPNPREPFGRFVVARLGGEVFVVQSDISGSSSLTTSAAQKLGLSFQSRDISIAIEAGEGNS